MGCFSVTSEQRSLYLRGHLHGSLTPLRLAGTPAVLMSDDENNVNSAANKEPQPLKGELRLGIL